MALVCIGKEISRCHTLKNYTKSTCDGLVKSQKRLFSVIPVTGYGVNSSRNPVF